MFRVLNVRHNIFQNIAFQCALISTIILNFYIHFKGPIQNVDCNLIGNLIVLENILNI